MIEMFNEMLEECRKQVKNSYSPYSGYRVGAALLTNDNKIIGGCNIENASYGLALCAERTTMFKAITMGYKPTEFKAIMIYTDRFDSIPYPCGACRQVVTELMGMDKKVIIVNDNLEPLEFTVSDLIPNAFTKDSI